MSPRFVLGQENVPCVPEVVDRSLKADCTDFSPFSVLFLVLIRAESSITLKATCAYK